MLNIGEKIIIVGLFLQIAFFGIFIVVATRFHVRFSKHGALTLNPRRSLWRRQMHALYWGSGLIMVRSVFRVIEYLMGNDGYLLRRELFLYIFDATLMFGLMVLFYFVHPSQLTATSSTGDESHSLAGLLGRKRQHRKVESSENYPQWR